MKAAKHQLEHRAAAPPPMLADAPIPSEPLLTLYVYVMASDGHDKLAVSMTQDIAQRVQNQKRDLHPRDYTSVNGIHTLVHVEEFNDLNDAMDRYERLRRMAPGQLRLQVEESNSTWTDLYDQYVP